MKKLLHAGQRVVEVARAPVTAPVAAGSLRVVLRDATRAAAFLARFAGSAANVLALRRLLAEDFGRTDLLRRTDAEVLAWVASLLATGQAVAVERAVARRALSRAADAAEPLEAPPVEAAEEPKTWIEIELVDMEGGPVRGARYWIELTDGTVREGRLDEHGRAYFGGLDPGDCTVRWPDLDEEATVPAPPDVPPRETTWIEIELQDMDGAPIPHERYHVTLPDGGVREGRLDALGRARIAGIDPGDCVVRWPDRDEEATVPVAMDVGGAGLLSDEPPEEDAAPTPGGARPGPRPVRGVEVEDAGSAPPTALLAEAQAAVLEAAAREGVAFCEVCERARRAREARV